MRTRLLAALALPLVLLVPRPAAADLLVSSVFTDEVLRYDGSTGAFLDAFVPRQQRAGLPVWPDLRPRRQPLRQQLLSGEVLRYDGRTGAFLDAFVSAGQRRAGLPDWPDFRPRRQPLRHQPRQRCGAALRREHRGVPRRLRPRRAAVGWFGPTGLTFGPDGNLYVTSSLNDQVLRYDGSTGAFLDAFVPSGSGGLGWPV